MKIRTLIFIIVGIILLLLLVSCVMKNIFFVTCFYKNNNSLNIEENKEIKSLLLNVMKERHSTVFTIDDKELYTKEYIQGYLHEGMLMTEKSFWVNINYNFMDSVEKKDDNEYTATIQMRSPDDWCYYFTIKIIDEQYIISYFEIDP